MLVRWDIKERAVLVIYLGREEAVTAANAAPSLPPEYGSPRLQIHPHFRLSMSKLEPGELEPHSLSLFFIPFIPYPLWQHDALPGLHVPAQPRLRHPHQVRQPR